MAELGVNIDHVATVREARKTFEPDPAWAAALAELGGADGITLHLREDRRHIQERDLRVMKETVHCKLNLEIACESEVLEIACDVHPEQVTLVPERREEITTEGGLDAVGQFEKVNAAVQTLKNRGIIVSLFLDPDEAQIEAAAKLKVDAVELHTGAYSLASAHTLQAELAKLSNSGKQICDFDMTLHAGHGLNYNNVQPVAALPQMCELNIGHSIIARSIMVGMHQAVREMKNLIV